jgi:hypothetical protein
MVRLASGTHALLDGLGNVQADQARHQYGQIQLPSDRLGAAAEWID